MMLEIYILYTVLAFFSTFFAFLKNSPIFFFFAVIFCGILIPTSFDVGKNVCVFSVTTNNLTCTQIKEQYPALAYLFLGLLLINLMMGFITFLKRETKTVFGT